MGFTVLLPLPPLRGKYEGAELLQGSPYSCDLGEKDSSDILPVGTGHAECQLAQAISPGRRAQLG